MNELYPFESRYLDLSGIRLHYVDEGPCDAPPIVMVHGNPTWSFYYRDMIKALRGRYRCIAPDHVGMGLSDKPDDEQYEYTLDRRVDDLGRLIDHLELAGDITLVLHDWGGMIGMAWAAGRPHRIARLVVLNTAAFPIPARKRLPPSLWLCRNTAVGAWLVRGFNFFARGAARCCVTRRPLTAEVRQMYLKPYDSWKNRIATLRFVQDIPLSAADRGYDTMVATGEALDAFRRKPTLICWGMRDFIFDDHFLDDWHQRFPYAELHRFADAGHYVLEDAGDQIIPLVENLLTQGT